MTRSLKRLLGPRTIAVIGGGSWCANVCAELAKIGFDGEVWRVHPREGFASVEALPSAPDAAFVGVNRDASVDVVASLSAMGAGGAVCFASGFAEAVAELDGADGLQARLLSAAGDMPILGPNCYGMINYLDRVALWPDSHGGVPVERGVALVTQSSNIAINLTMQARGVPLSYVVTAGNQAQQGFAALGAALLDDPRVTALGLHIEGFGDAEAFFDLAQMAHDLGKPIVALKVGRSEEAQAATVSHTASLAGSVAGSDALLARAGVAQVATLEGLLEALKIAHVHGNLASASVASMSCSGGEASLVADLGAAAGLSFPPLIDTQRTALRAALGPKVALANPLDYHTYIWADEDAMAQAFTAMMTPEHAIGVLVIDTPRQDRCDASAWEPAFRALARAQKDSGRPMAALASLAETLPEELANRLMAQGIVPLTGLSSAFEAIAAMGSAAPLGVRPLPARSEIDTVLVDEARAKSRLERAGVDTPKSDRAMREDAVGIAGAMGGPVVLKSLGLAHKSDAGGVVLGVQGAAAAKTAIEGMPDGDILVEEMITGAVAELLVGVVNDPAHGMVLTLGRGGTETELHRDVVHALLPVTEDDIRTLLSRLRMAPLLEGYRGRPGADLEAIVRTVRAVQDLVIASPELREIEINPLLCLADRAVAVDALIREGEG